MLIDRNKLFNLIICVFIYVLAIYLISNLLTDKSAFKMTCYIVMGLNIYMAFRNRKNTMLFFVYIVMLYFNFSCMYDVYILDDIFLHRFYAQMPEEELLGKGVYMMLLFTNTLFLMDILKKPTGVSIKNEFFIDSNNQNLILGYALMVISSLVGVISGSWYEYSGAITIVAILFGGKNKWFRILVFIYLVLYVINANGYGTRIGVLNISIVLLFVYFSNKINFKRLLVCIAIGVVLMTYSGLYTDSGGRATLSDAIAKLEESGGALDTSQFAYMSSQLGIKTADDVLNNEERKEYFKNFLKSQVVLNSGNIKNCKMSIITHSYFNHFYGQFFPHTMYFYLGWFGVILGGIVVGLYLLVVKMININSNNVIKLVALWTTSMIGKWYLYEPNSLLKGILFVLIVYVCASFVNKVMRKSIKFNAQVTNYGDKSYVRK